MDRLSIRVMQPSDLDFAAACTAGEGWTSETRPVFEGFHAHDPDGCFVAWVHEERAGICVATEYGTAGFIGELIVVPGMRKRGIGRQLLEHAIGYLQGRGVQSIYLDGVAAAVPLYERLGFRRLCRSLRFSGRLGFSGPLHSSDPLPGRMHPGVRSMEEGDLDAVCRIDRAAFGADRRFFLERRFRYYPRLCKVLEQEGEICGFVFGRCSDQHVSAGPWVVQAGVTHPERLLESLSVEAGSRTLGLGVLETNETAVAIIRSLGFHERTDPPWRMAFGAAGWLGTAPTCYAIGSPAKG